MKRLTADKIKKVIKEELSDILSEDEKSLKDIAYEFSRKMGLRKAYYGAFISFDGSWNDLQVSVEYNGSHSSLEVYVSPKFNPPGNSQVMVFGFDSPSEYSVKEKGGENLGSYKYTSVDNFLSKIKEISQKFE